MKKIGFTLAEVLITLGIVGVVAALTAPALVQNAGTAQIGPKLAKAVSTIETATETTLLEEGESSIYSMMGDVKTGDVSNFTEKLKDHMKMSKLDDENLTGKWDDKTIKAYDGTNAVVNMFSSQNYYGDVGYKASSNKIVKYISKEGMIYTFSRGKALKDQSNRNIGKSPAHQIMGSVMIDVNGTAAPNRFGKDIFVFSWWNDGSLRAFGSKDFTFNENSSQGSGETEKKFYWAETCSENGVTNSGLFCAGSVFENNLKVVYQ